MTLGCSAAMALGYAGGTERAMPHAHMRRMAHRGPQGPGRARGRHGRRQRRPPLSVQVSVPDSVTTVVTAGATALAAIAAVLAFFVAWKTFKGSQRTERKRREDDSVKARERLTYEYVGRLEDLALTEHKAVMASFLRGGFKPPGMPGSDWKAAESQGPEAAGLAAWRYLRDAKSVDDRKAVLQIVAFPNMLETLAGLYNHGLLDYGIVKTRVENQASTFWKQAKWWIRELEDQYTDETLKDLRVMIDDLPRQQKPSPYKA
jgi:hypothetical protein